MKALVLVSVIAAVLGYGLGAVVAYVEVPPTLVAKPVKQSPKTTSSQPTSSFPKVEFPETVFEFGNIERGTSMSHAFKVSNLGDQPLKIEVESTTCKCTVGDLEDNVIGPGEESEVMLEWVAKTPPGPFRHGAVISTNDPTQSSIDLTVEGQVVESTAMYPAELIFGTVRIGESKSAHLYLMQFLDDEIEVLNYELSDEDLAQQIEVSITEAETAELPQPEAVGGLKVAATYKSGKTVGPFQCWLTLTTNLKNAEKLSVPIAGNVVGDVSIFHPGWNAQRGLLRMGSFPSGKGKKLTLKVAIRGEHDEDTQLQVAQVDPPELQATLGEPQQLGDKLQHIPLVLEVPAGTAPMVRIGEPTSSDAEVLLKSSNGKIPDVRLRVHFAVE